jgi:hypothetical protein
MNRKIRHLWSKFTQDNKGRRVLWQRPNLALVGWAIFRVLAHFVESSGIKAGLGSIGSAFLFTWAYLEIVNGASYFRRTLGAIIAIYLCLSYFN